MVALRRIWTNQPLTLYCERKVRVKHILFSSQQKSHDTSQRFIDPSSVVPFKCSNFEHDVKELMNHQGGPLLQIVIRLGTSTHT